MATVKGVLVSAMKAYLIQEYGPDAVAAAMKELAPEEVALVDRRFLDGSMYPYETMIAMRHLMRLLATNPNAAADLGAFLAEFIFKGVYKPLLATDPSAMVAKIPWVKDFFYNDTERVDATMTGASACTLVYRYEDVVRPARAVCQSLGRFWARTLELTGAPKVTVEHHVCRRDGADRCEFTLRW